MSERTLTWVLWWYFDTSCSRFRFYFVTVCGRDLSVSPALRIWKLGRLCVKLAETTKRLELGVLDAVVVVGDLQQELRVVVYDGFEGLARVWS